MRRFTDPAPVRRVRPELFDGRLLRWSHLHWHELRGRVGLCANRRFVRHRQLLLGQLRQRSLHRKTDLRRFGVELRFERGVLRGDSVLCRRPLCIELWRGEPRMHQRG